MWCTAPVSLVSTEVSGGAHLPRGVTRDPPWRLRALGDELEPLEINPLLVEGSTVEALDAVVTWTDKYQ